MKDYILANRSDRKILLRPTVNGESVEIELEPLTFKKINIEQWEALNKRKSFVGMMERGQLAQQDKASKVTPIKNRTNKKSGKK